VFSFRGLSNGASVTVHPLAEPARAPQERDLWIPMPDGARLAAHVWLPPEAETSPVGAILEASPYRHEDHTRRRDLVRHPYFAENGFASLRVDLRGSGASDGVLLDEYTEEEQSDVYAAIQWIAEQPWCNGSVGMIGISWGGFAALQAAARRPPALKAIVVACASADRYGADVKYKGGALLACELFPWSSTMLAMNARPPDPALVGDAWRDRWLERLEAAVPFAETWLRHQRRDDYWAVGSPCEDYSTIECPVYAVGGWADPYRQAVLDLLERLACPRKGLIGPWSHQYPEEGKPGPTIDFRRECVRWWEQWLTGADTGIMDEPELTYWMREPPTVEGLSDRSRGRWMAEAAWPSPSVTALRLRLGRGTLGKAGAESAELSVAGVENCGTDAGAWCPWDVAELPRDQRCEDALSLAFTSAPLEGRLEILGAPALALSLASDAPSASVIVRLCDVAPDGSSTLITRGVLNLAHRDGSAEPTMLEAGQRAAVRIPLEAAAYALPPGHRLRVAVSPTYWPWVWPAPEPVVLTIYTGDSSLELPARVPDADAPEPPPFDPAPELNEPALCECTRASRFDSETGRCEFVVDRRRGRRVVRDDGLEVAGSQIDRFSIMRGDPLSASLECERVLALERGSWSPRVEATTRLTADCVSFHLFSRIEAYEAGERIFEAERSVSIPRDLV
jgi:putative CocE/NonD family hydrolase